MCSSAGVTRPSWSEEKKLRYPGAADIPIVRLNPFNILNIKKDGKNKAVWVQDRIDVYIIRPVTLSEICAVCTSLRTHLFTAQLIDQFEYTKRLILLPRHHSLNLCTHHQPHNTPGEQALRDSGALYTIVRPTGLNDKFPSGGRSAQTAY